MSINFKHLIGLLVVCALLSACGKEKQKVSTSSSTACNPYYYSTYSGYPCNTTGTTNYNPTTGATFGDFESFRTAVRNSQFVPVAGFNEVYYYGSCTSSTDSWFIFSWGTSSCSSSFQVNYLNGQVSGRNDGATTEAAVKAKLIEIVNAATGTAGSFQIISNQRVRFVSGSYIYEYHLGFPAAANPVSRSNLSGSSRYDLYDVKSWKL